MKKTNFFSFSITALVLTFLQEKPASHGPIEGLLNYSIFDGSDLPSGNPVQFQTHLRLGEQDHILNLRLHSMRSDDFRLLTYDLNGRLVPTEPPPVQSYRGNVEGVEGSLVAASLGDKKLSAMIVLAPGDIWQIQPHGAGHIVYQNSDSYLDPSYHCAVLDMPNTGLRSASLGNSPRSTGTAGVVGAGQAGPDGEEGEEVEPPVGLALTGNKVCDIALDADYEFFQVKHGGNMANCLRDMEDILNRVETIYDTEVDIVYEVTTIVVRTAEPDPYSSTNSDTLLNQFRTEWNTNPILGNDVRRDLAELFTGKNVDGNVIGIAWLGVVCASRTSGYGYSVVESRFTTNMAQRTALSAHELGHNWNAGHCNGQGDCGIMCSSICGCNCDLTHFGVQETNSIVAHRNSRSCLVDEQDPLSLNFFDEIAGTLIDPAKWSYNNGATVSTAALGEPSAPYSLLLNSSGADVYLEDDLRSNFINLAGASNIWVSYTTERNGVEAGEQLLIDYWNNNLQWVNLNTLNSDGINQSEFSYFTHLLPANALHSEFRLRLRTNGNEANDNWYVDDIAVSRVKTLNVQSNPISGVSITTSPKDNSGQGAGNTPYARVYNEGKLVSLTAPINASGKTFFEWKINGISQGATQSIDVIADADKTALAEYKSVYAMTIQSIPASGVNIAVSPPDRDGNSSGTTSFVRSYWEGQSLTLTAPITDAQGRKFMGWTLNGNPQARGLRSILFTPSADTLAVAHYYSLFAAEAFPIGIDPIDVMFFDWP